MSSTAVAQQRDTPLLLPRTHAPTMLSKAQLEPFMSLFLQNNPKIKSLTNVEPEKSKKPNTEVQMNAHMASQKKKVMIKRETDKSFAFLKVET